MKLIRQCVSAAVTFILILAFNAIESAGSLLYASTPISGDRKIQLNLSAQPLPKALKAVGDTYDLIIIFGDDVSADVLSQQLHGTYTVAEALTKLLRNTGLEFIQVGDAAFTIKKRVRQPIFSKKTKSVAQPVPPEMDNTDVPSVVVTGSRLGPNAADSSAKRVYGKEAIEQSGAATLSELSRIFPENFNSIGPISSLFGNAVGVPQLGNNAFLGSGFNLAGLGPEATLTLLDGDRWVSAGAAGSFLDLSVLPLNAVASVETLTGDTSAVYGSDAIAGVANILLRSGKDGNETSVRYGGTSGAGQWVLSQRLGGSWQSGDGMIAYQHVQQSALTSGARGYIPSVSPEIDVVPQQSSSGILGTLELQLTRYTSVKVHALYGARDVTDNSSGFGGYPLSRDAPVREYGGTVHIDHQLTPDWMIDLYGSYSKLVQSLTTIALGEPEPVQGQPGNSSLGEFALSAKADPIKLYGRSVGVTFGAGARKETLTVPTSPYGLTYGSLARKVGDLYVETLIPLIGARHPLAKRFDLSVAVREDYYEGVGSTLNPRAGIVWSPGSDLNFRGSFARSFRPPSLKDLAAIPFYYTANIPNGASQTDILVNQSQGMARLKPETARTLTGGLDYRRDQPRGWTGSVTWFRTVFDDRVAAPVTGSVATDIFTQRSLTPYISSITPNEVREIFANPAFVDFVGTGPDGVTTMFDNQLTNIARTFEKGLAASLRYSQGEPSHQFRVFAIANYLLENTYQFPGTQTLQLMSNVGQPPKLRARGGISGSWNDWRAAVNANYTNGYRNTLISPSQAVKPWTTFDFQLAWHLPIPDVPNVRLTFDASNVLNTRPPWVYVPPAQSARPVGFDAANASPLGRMLSLELSAAW